MCLEVRAEAKGVSGPREGMRAEESLRLEAGVRREGQEGPSWWGGRCGGAGRGTQPPGGRRWSAKSWPREGGPKGAGSHGHSSHQLRLPGDGQ